MTAPAAGSYGLAVSGQEDARFGPLSFCGRKLPTASQMVVAPAEGEPDGSYNLDVRYYPDDAGQHDERTILRYAPDAVSLRFESGAVTCAGIRSTSEVSYPDGQAAVRLPLHVGATWSGTGSGPQRQVTYTVRVLDRQAVTVQGERFDTYVIERRSTFTGTESGQRTQRWWYSPRLAVPLRWEDQVTGSRSGASYTGRITVTVDSLPQDGHAAQHTAAGHDDAYLTDRSRRVGTTTH